MATYAGFVKPNGTVEQQKGNFTVTVDRPGRNFTLEFDEEMTNAVVLATSRFLQENYGHDHRCTPVVVSNAPRGRRDTLGFSICAAEEGDRWGFCFTANT